MKLVLQVVKTIVALDVITRVFQVVLILVKETVLLLVHLLVEITHVLEVVLLLVQLHVHLLVM